MCGFLSRTTEKAAAFIQRRFVWMIAGSYLVAALAPDLGLRLRALGWRGLGSGNGELQVTLPTALLALLLFNAGLGVRLRHLNELVRSPWALLVGLAANSLTPLLFLIALSLTIPLWHNRDEPQSLLVGLALVASMPIAGSSTAWSQNANGDPALSLGLVLASTLLSPLTTPPALLCAGLMTDRVHSDALSSIASGGAGSFLALFVLAPSIVGIAVGHSLGASRVAALKSRLKLANSVVLITLCYMNASVSLPDAVARPDFDFLALVVAATFGLCLIAFASGWTLGTLMGISDSRRTSLMFGLGMNNNGTGLVLASIVLAEHPRALLPVLIYNLVQHLVAGCVQSWSRRVAIVPSPA